MVEHPGGARFLLEALQPLAIAERDGVRTLIATSRPSRVSFARYTTPIPPSPITPAMR